MENIFSNLNNTRIVIDMVNYFVVMNSIILKWLRVTRSPRWCRRTQCCGFESDTGQLFVLSTNNCFDFCHFFYVNHRYIYKVPRNIKSKLPSVGVNKCFRQILMKFSDNLRINLIKFDSDQIHSIFYSLFFCI